MKTIVIIAVVLVLLNSVALAQTLSCDEKMAMNAEQQTDDLKQWNQVYSSFKRYAVCDDGAIAEGYSDAVVKLLANHWDTLPQLETLSAKDASFRNFVLRHIDATADEKVLAHVARNSKHNCPSLDNGLCADIVRQVRYALLDSNAAVRPRPALSYPDFSKPPVLTDRLCSGDTDCASGLKCLQVAFKPPDQWTTQCAFLPYIVYPAGTQPIPEGADSIDYPDFRTGGTLPAGFPKIHSLREGKLPPALQGYEWVYAPESGCDLDGLCGMAHTCIVDDHPERLPSDWFQSYILKREDFYCLQYRSRGFVPPLEGVSLAAWASTCASSSRTTVVVDPSLRGARLTGNGLMRLDSKNYLCDGFVELLRQQGITIIKDGDVYRVVKGTANAAVPGAPSK